MNNLTVTKMPEEEETRPRMECRTCPYEHLIEQKTFSRRYFWTRKEEDYAVKKLLEKSKADRAKAGKERATNEVEGECAHGAGGYGRGG
jgi:DNA-directed RNA polymerase subunit M/transcription elongation factor TFIIS